MERTGMTTTSSFLYFRQKPYRTDRLVLHQRGLSCAPTLASPCLTRRPPCLLAQAAEGPSKGAAWTERLYADGVTPGRGSWCGQAQAGAPVVKGLSLPQTSSAHCCHPSTLTHGGLSEAAPGHPLLRGLLHLPPP